MFNGGKEQTAAQLPNLNLKCIIFYLLAGPPRNQWTLNPVISTC